MDYRLTKIKDFQNALISRLFGVFACGFLYRTTLFISQNHFQHVFAKKKVENILHILHGLQAYQDGGFSKCCHISTIWCFSMRFFAQNHSIYFLESFSACFCEKKVENNLPILHGLQAYQDGGFSKCSHISTGVFTGVFLHRTTLFISYNHFQHVFSKKKLKITCPFCMGYRLTKVEDFQDALIFRLIGVFTGGFFAQNNSIYFLESFSACFCEKKS